MFPDFASALDPFSLQFFDPSALPFASLVLSFIILLSAVHSRPSSLKECHPIPAFILGTIAIHKTGHSLGPSFPPSLLYMQRPVPKSVSRSTPS
ncbi:hypothetical protein F4809DRAFT_68415 [Biscogniauxia mediterranea]|nr:hypothetical protein F4809DRAFT_68415 [Biscogniauxia mediterranea]